MNSFAELQPFENSVLPACLQAAGVEWLLELAPVTSPAPAITVPRHRMLLGENGWCWPMEAPADALPFEDESLPACLLRHLIQPDVPDELFPEVLRCLRPGGLLVVVNPNPWHWRAWQGLGGAALWLPSWPVLQMMALSRGLMLQHAGPGSWRAWVPCARPLLVLAVRKPPSGRVVRPMKLRQPAIGRQTAVTGHLRSSAGHLRKSA